MRGDLGNLLLTPDETADADREAARSGLDSYGLMERAGQAVAAAALCRFPGAKRFVVLAGPGNNGGDGYVAARALASAGAEIVLHAFGDPARLGADAARAHARCRLPVRALGDWRPGEGDVVVDAVFGAGLSRDVPDELRAAISKAMQHRLPVLAVDLPSGVCGRTGQVRGAAFQASHTVTFMTRKPGHVLLPGRMLCGEMEVFDIGIPERIVKRFAGRLRLNQASLWSLPDADAASHKFSRGHLGVFSGPASATGAARLSAIAGLRAGAGLVTLAARREAMAVLAAHVTAVMLQEIDGANDIDRWVKERRLTAFVIGPGFGSGQTVRDYVWLVAGRPLVLDADGITAFRDQPDVLFSLYPDGAAASLVMTPHQGEFTRLFPDIAADERLSKIEKALAAAVRSRAVVVYKGADSVIAAPDGRAFVNVNAPPWLATAGSGDVLAGVIGGLMAQGMPAFEAAAAGVWLHAEAGSHIGRGLTAEGLPQAVADIIRSLPRRPRVDGAEPDATS